MLLREFCVQTSLAGCFYADSRTALVWSTPLSRPILAIPREWRIWAKAKNSVVLVKLVKLPPVLSSWLAMTPRSTVSVAPLIEHATRNHTNASNELQMDRSCTAIPWETRLFLLSLSLTGSRRKEKTENPTAKISRPNIPVSRREEQVICIRK